MADDMNMDWTRNGAFERRLGNNLRSSKYLKGVGQTLEQMIETALLPLTMMASFDVYLWRPRIIRYRHDVRADTARGPHHVLIEESK